MKSFDNIMAVVMGGGQGTRLYPLTKERAKPAVPIAGKYRLIDIPISNCINSGLFKIAVLTQFNSVSLHRHISQTYFFDAFHTGWVQIWAAEQTAGRKRMVSGNGRCCRKQITEIKSARVPLCAYSGWRPSVPDGLQRDGRISLGKGSGCYCCCSAGHRAEAPRLGILKRDWMRRIVRFAEKPKDRIFAGADGQPERDRQTRISVRWESICSIPMC